MKSDAQYRKCDYNAISLLFKEYQRSVDTYHKRCRHSRVDTFEYWQQKKQYTDSFRSKCEMICPNEDELCNILIDICYSTERSKQFVWDMCGEVMLNNLLQKNNMTIHYPKLVCSDGDFTYCGEQFSMIEEVLSKE